MELDAQSKRYIETKPTPLLLVNIENGKRFNFKVDYVKALMDYNVSASLPEMSPVDMTKMINFFVSNEIVNAHRPEKFDIKHIEQAHLMGGDIFFSMELNNSLKSEKEVSELYRDFYHYFDLWMEKFVIVYGKYIQASNAGVLDKLLVK